MTKNYFEQESGRSMVEMLGVLAIIGVLSVGGISGYTTAMNKHKANEILNAAAVRAMAVSTQLQSGVTDPTLAEFPTGEEVGGAKFGDVSKVGDSQFKIGFTTQPAPAVVEQMKNIAGTDGIVRDLTGTGITYNNDLTADKIASDFTYDTCPSNFVKCGKTNSCVATATDCQCPTHATDNGDSCTCNAGYTGPKCDICAEGYEKESDGTCIIPTPTCKGAESVGDDCENNTGLCPGYYCQIAVGTATPDTDSGERYCGDSKYTPGAGTIVVVTAPNKITSSYYKGPMTNWDDAKSYCEGLKIAHDAGVKIGGIDYPITTGLVKLPSSCSVEKKCSILYFDDSYFWLDQLSQTTCEGPRERISGSENNQNSGCGFYVTDSGYIADDYTRSSYEDIYALCE